MKWMYQYRYYCFVILLSILPFLFWVDPQTLVHTHDGLVHLPRMAAFYKALIDLHIPVRFAGELNYGYGMPLFIFIYHTPYFVSSLFIAFGLGLVHAFKLTLLTSFLLSGLFMYLFSKAFFKDEKTALFVTLLYQFAPFHLVDLLIRGSFGEVFTYAFLPLVLFALHSYFLSRRIGHLLLSALATGFLILSHNSISLLFFGISVLFVLIFGTSVRTRLVAFGGLFLGLALSAYYWIPALLEHKYTYGNLYMQDLFRDRFPVFWKLFIPNFSDAQSLLTDHLALHIGLIHLIALLAGVVWLVKRKSMSGHKGKVLGFSLLLILGSSFFMTTASLPVWDFISFLRQFQFPWRFLTVFVFAGSLLGVFLMPYLKKPVVYGIVLGAIVVSSVIYWFPKEGYRVINEKYYWDFPLNTTYYGETDVIWSAGPATSYPKQKIELISGEGSVELVHLSTARQKVVVDAQTPVTIVSNTQYFPGWKVYLKQNGETAETPIQFQDPNYRGLIQFSVPEGSYEVSIIFEESKIRLFGNLLTMLSFIVIVTLFVTKREKKL